MHTHDHIMFYICFRVRKAYVIYIINQLFNFCNSLIACHNKNSFKRITKFVVKNFKICLGNKNYS